MRNSFSAFSAAVAIAASMSIGITIKSSAKQTPAAQSLFHDGFDQGKPKYRVIRKRRSNQSFDGRNANPFAPGIYRFDQERVIEAIERRNMREFKRIENARRTAEGRRFHGMAQC